MKRAALAALLISAACTSTATSPVAKLANPTAVAQVGRFMLVLDEDRSQARALALTATNRAIVRAPDPIYALAIPSAPYPNAIAAFTPYVLDTSGESPKPSTLDPLPLAFILSTSSSQVTVFRSGDLTRLGEFQVPDTTTAIAVQPCADPNQCSQEATNLLLAVSEPTGAALYKASFPNPFGEDQLPSIKLTRIVDLGANSRPQALAFSPSDRNLVAVADQNAGDDGQGRTGSLALVDLQADLAGGIVTRFAIGGPLLNVAIDPTGTRLFGLIDSAACGEAVGCFGVVGFQLKTSNLAPGVAARTQVPFPGAAPIPVPAGSAEGVARGIAASAMDSPISVTPATGTAADVSPVVMVSLANGSVALIDGLNMVPVNNSGTAEPVVSVLFHRDASGAAVTASPDPTVPTNLGGSLGATHTEVVTITNGGALPSLTRRTGVLDPSSATLTASGLDFPALGVRPGDRVRFDSGCSAAATARVAAAAAGALTLSSIQGCSAAGATAVTFDVTAPPPGDNPAADEYVVAGTVSGLMGRVHPGEAFTFTGPSFKGAPTGTALSFTMGSGDHGDGAVYALSLFSGFTAMDISLRATSAVLTMPGAVAFDPQLRLFYIAYQGGGALVEMDPTAIRAGSTSQGLAVFR